MATATEVRGLLGPTSLPDDLVTDLLAGASALWLMGETAEQVAGDLALCHPPLGDGEVRALAFPLEGGAHRLAIACRDRTGLLAATAGALAVHGLSISSVSASTWPDLDLAVQRVVAACPEGDPADWDAVGTTLRSALGGTHRPDVRFTPAAPVFVEAINQDGGRTMVSVRAPDRIGLLWAIASWFEGVGANIEVARVGGADGTATDTFVVCCEPGSPVDAEALASHLSGQGAGPRLALPLLALAVPGLVLSTVAVRLVLRAAGAVLGRASSHARAAE